MIEREDYENKHCVRLNSRPFNVPVFFPKHDLALPRVQGKCGEMDNRSHPLCQRARDISLDPLPIIIFKASR